WSRYSGGSGAPGWTFEVVGLDIRSFKPTGAAYVHQTNATPGDSLPMVWPTNYTKLASATMFTLFFGGDTFAPRCMYQGETVQGFLQKRFIDCYRHLAGYWVWVSIGGGDVTKYECVTTVTQFGLIDLPSPPSQPPQAPRRGDGL
ncbi:hypothetical protein BC938DRAFT_478132, partial [Jimgerdemannia flammicorona]